MATLTWWGHAFFSLQTDSGRHLAIDPYNEAVGYQMPRLEPTDAVAISHEHGDHNNLGAVPGKPEIVRGLEADEGETIEHTVAGELKIRMVPTFHDTEQGALRGRNTVLVIEVEGLRVAHCGDLGHQLSPAQVEAIGRVDVLLVPVGGHYTIDAAGASAVLKELKPSITIPMHYKTAAVRLDSPIGGVEPFLTGKNVRRLEHTNRLDISASALPKQPEVVVLGYSPERS